MTGSFSPFLLLPFSLLPFHLLTFFAITMATVSEPDHTNGTAMDTTEDSKGAEVNGNHQEVHYALPDAKTLQEVGEMKIKDENDNEIAFKSLYEGKEGRQLIVFIRHFYCGVRLPHVVISLNHWSNY